MDNNNQENPIEEAVQVLNRNETSHPFNKQSLGTLNGRMGRLDYAILSFSLGLLVLIVEKLLGINQFLVIFSSFTDEVIISESLLKTAVLIGYIQILLFALITVKRLHDINYSGWLAMIFIIPLINLGLLTGLLVLIGIIIRLILLFAKGEPNKNKFGPIPDANHRNKLLLFIGVLILNYLIFSNMYGEAFPIINPIWEQLILEMQQQ